MIQALGEF